MNDDYDRLTKMCPKHGQYIGVSLAECPVCAGIQKHGRWQRQFRDYDYEVERALRERPKSGPVDDDE